MHIITKLSPALLILTLFLGFADKAFAQKSDKLEAEKVAFFTRELSLTKTEAERFWPIYNDFSNRKDRINRDRKVLYEYIATNKDNMSDAEVQDALTKFILYQNQETILIESYHKKFLEILPPKKVMLIYVTENQFKVYILRQIRDNRQVPVRDF